MDEHLTIISSTLARVSILELSTGIFLSIMNYVLKFFLWATTCKNYSSMWTVRVMSVEIDEI